MTEYSIIAVVLNRTIPETLDFNVNSVLFTDRKQGEEGLLVPSSRDFCKYRPIFAIIHW